MMMEIIASISVKPASWQEILRCRFIELVSLFLPGCAGPVVGADPACRAKNRYCARAGWLSHDPQKDRGVHGIVIRRLIKSRCGLGSAAKCAGGRKHHRPRSAAGWLLQTDGCRVAEAHWRICSDNNGERQSARQQGGSNNWRDR